MIEPCIPRDNIETVSRPLALCNHIAQIGRKLEIKRVFSACACLIGFEFYALSCDLFHQLQRKCLALLCIHHADGIVLTEIFYPDKAVCMNIFIVYKVIIHSGAFPFLIS